MYVLYIHKYIPQMSMHFKCELNANFILDIP